VENNNYDCVNALLAAGADVEAAGKDGRTPLHYSLSADCLRGSGCC
jgi:ankyrin repeat protein